MSKITRKAVTGKTASAPKNILIVDNQSVHLESLRLIIDEKVIGDINFRLEATRDVTSDHIDWADLVVLSGGTGRSIEKNPKTFKRLVAALVASQKPVVGICLGAEAIAVYYGAKLKDIGVRRAGNIAIYLYPEFASAMDLKERSIVYEFHRWSIPELGEPLVALAESKDGVEIFRHTMLPIWGLQFHPEVRRRNNGGHTILESILQMLIK